MSVSAEEIHHADAARLSEIAQLILPVNDNMGIRPDPRAIVIKRLCQLVDEQARAGAELARQVSDLRDEVEQLRSKGTAT